MRTTITASLYLLASTTVFIQFPLISRAAEPVKIHHSIEPIDQYVQAEMKKHAVPAVSIAIVEDGKLVCAKGYGMANAELSVPATETTVYQLASVTKQFTATAIMMLVEEGKLGLEDKISKHLAGLPTAWENVTIRHLLNHTSGIKSYTSVRDFLKKARTDFSHQEILELVAKDPVEFVSGEKWSYSNTGYFLLGMVIEKVTGKTYGEFLDQRIFKPLGMTQTRVNDLRAIIPHRAQGYDSIGKLLLNGEYVSPTQPFAAGALVSSVSDMVKWDAALSTEKLLKKPSLEQMMTPTKTTKSGPVPYGFGWQVDTVNGHRRITHGGGIPGFSTQISRFPDDKLTVVVLTNASDGHAASLASGIAGRILPALAKKAEMPIADSDPATTRQLKNILLTAMNGDVDPALFTEDAKKALVPRIRDDSKRMFSPFGPLKAFELLERKSFDQGSRLRYRATFAKHTLVAICVLDKAGKVAGLELRPEE